MKISIISENSSEIKFSPIIRDGLPQVDLFHLLKVVAAKIAFGAIVIPKVFLSEKWHLRRKKQWLYVN